MSIELKELLAYNAGYEDGKRDAMPKQGKWEQVEVIGYDGNSMNDDAAQCSVCGHVEQSDYWARTYYHYCPNCGARMDGERSET